MKRKVYQLSDFTDLKGCGANWVGECPLCHHKNLYISKKNGLYNCFSADCDFHGILDDFRSEDDQQDVASDPLIGPAPSQARLHLSQIKHPRQKSHVNADPELLPEDYKPLPASTWDAMSALSETDPATPQQVVRTYLTEQGISIQSAIDAGICVAQHSVYGKDEKGEDVTLTDTCMVYVNYVNGKPVNAKYRGMSAKMWSQVSPTKPCAPYGIDCLNPLLQQSERVDRLIITEGEKDTLTLRSLGFPHVISMPSGAETNPRECFSGFQEWLQQVDSVTICGDADRPGRKMVSNLQEYFGSIDIPCRIVDILMPGCKDISDVNQQYGNQTARDLVEQAQPRLSEDVVTVQGAHDRLLKYLKGYRDEGYDLGYGPLTNQHLHLTHSGGLIVVTGTPGSGKTDWLRCTLTQLMIKRGEGVCYLSFEEPDKEKSMWRIASLILGTVRTEEAPEELTNRLLNQLDPLLIHLDMRQNSPTPANITRLANEVRLYRNIRYLVIDPYVYVDTGSAGNKNETEVIRDLLRSLHEWGVSKGVWVFVVAHPRKLSSESGELEEINMYTISGSAHWANLADFILSVRRKPCPSHDPSMPRTITCVDVLKVRDQDLCQPGQIHYLRSAVGRYTEVDTDNLSSFVPDDKMWL